MQHLLTWLSAFGCGLVCGSFTIIGYAMLRLAGNISEQHRRNGKDE